MTPEPGSDRGDAPDPREEPGYWERHAAEQASGSESASEPPQQEGGVFNPQSAQPTAPGPYEASSQVPPGYPQGYPGQPYGGPTGQPAPASWPGYATPPRQPQAGTALVLGLIGLIGALFTCGASLLLSPFAWGVGRGSLAKIRASGGQLSGEGDARTGMVLGIIGSVLLVVGIFVVIAIVVILLNVGPLQETGFDEGTPV